MRSPITDRWIAVALTAALPLAACHRSADRDTAPPAALVALTDSLDAFLLPLMEEFETPGVAVALIHRGRLVRTEVLGVASVLDSIPVTSRTVFNVGSISKSVTAWAVLWLVEEGRLDLDAPASRFLTGWSPPPSEFTADSMTIRRLLSHTAGLSLSGYPGFELDQPLGRIARRCFERGRACRTRLRARHQCALLGRRLHGSATRCRRGGGPVVRRVRARCRARAAWQGALDVRAGSAGLGGPDFAAPHSGGRVIPRRRFAALAAAGLSTTLGDMVRFMTAEMPVPNEVWDARPLLSDETVAVMHQPVPPARYYGLGHQVRASGAYVAVGHVGANRGWQAQYELIRGTGEGMVILTNANGGFMVHNQLACEWLFAITETWHAEFCETVPSSRMFDMIEEYRALADSGQVSGEAAALALADIQDAKTYLNGPENRVEPVVEALRLFADRLDQAEVAASAAPVVARLAVRARLIASEIARFAFP